MAAADRVGGQAATLLRRLAVEASDADTDDVVAGVVRLAADRVVRDLQLDARHASSVEDRQGFAQAIAWLKTQSEQLSERSARSGGRPIATVAQPARRGGERDRYCADRAASRTGSGRVSGSAQRRWGERPPFA